MMSCTYRVLFLTNVFTVLAAALKLFNETDAGQDMNTIWRKLNGNNLEYPESLTPDNDVFRHLALIYSKTHPTMHSGKPCPTSRKIFKEGITNGAAWYPLTGGMQDYNYWSAGCMEITLEIGCCKFPFPEELPKIWMDNKQALVAFISEAHQGIRGVIRDNTTLIPISGAQLRVYNRSMSFKSNAQGEFWRILLPGNYQLEVYAADYEPAMLTVTVTEHKEDERSLQTWLDIYMQKRPPTGERKPHTEQPVVTFMNTTTTTTTTTTSSVNNVSATQPSLNNNSHGIRVSANTSDDKESNVLVNRSASLKLEASQMKSNADVVHSRLLFLGIVVIWPLAYYA